ncbi:ergothioneine biosynthesis protein EgtB [Sphingobium yanoikuyae]|jgi:ergothioneine biosynthesis protein EgtB|uniref:Ergothioneine biosynthesis protein EgtB n=1 Tax=Sphingobium yanoikuyae TaxID=13690 RepID=A0A430BNC9_SPHYA|nr:ergothioneine biosynthesis protein EgtB [Sphingobium yanoikuyae]RSU54169.1 ergothioneine biosynthesis protein EgtB [Sphingobium yanoikuyae]
MATKCTASTRSTDPRREDLLARYESVRASTVSLTSNLSDADASAQSMPDASPAKWHLAHTTWFFETFILTETVSDYQAFDPRFSFLFNSYYEGKGPRLDRAKRGLITRPSLSDVLAYRRYVDAALGAAIFALPEAAIDLVELGCQHEEQHQELLLTDILHLFAQNPLQPALWPSEHFQLAGAVQPMTWIEGREGAAAIGHDGTGFGFDSEGPQHTTWLAPHALANRLVTNGEWRQFMDDGGYRASAHWLSDGWAWVQKNAIEAPLYWRHKDGLLLQFGLYGSTALDPHAPVRHISYYEADAFARWAGARLPTEPEWESAAQAKDSSKATLANHGGPVGPKETECDTGLVQMFEHVWEWTGSAYLAYPGFRPAAGAVGEYNGKFMSGQFVLKGGSCATPQGHSRPSYRNFFYPHQRWQFTGLRLAKDL